MTGLWLARSQHDILLQNAEFACSMMEKKHEEAQMRAKSILDKVGVHEVIRRDLLHVQLH